MHTLSTGVYPLYPFTKTGFLDKKDSIAMSHIHPPSIICDTDPHKSVSGRVGTLFSTVLETIAFYFRCFVNRRCPAVFYYPN